MTGNEAPKSIPVLGQNQWNVNPSTGIISLPDELLQEIINVDPIEKWYKLDPEPLARGQFAVVYHCYHRITGAEYAAKFSSRWRFGTDCMEDLVHEIAACSLLKSQNRAIQLTEVFSTPREIILVMEYAPGGDLQTLLDEDLVPYERDVVSFIRQLLDILVNIHDMNMVHLDIKPQNLVLMGEFPECEVKLCDFEISRMLTEGHDVKEILGTPDYVAPEILHYEPITTKTDMWSVGVLTYVLLTGFLPFGGDSDQETFLEISRCELDFPPQLFEDVTPEAIDFIKMLLVRQPERRMSAKECFTHTWMRTNTKRPTPPRTLNLMHINTPSINIEDTNEDCSPTRARHISAERSISCPISESPETRESTDNESQLPTHQTRVPYYTSTSQRSLSNEKTTSVGTPGTLMVSPFFRSEMRSSSRQNLDKLKAMSKSREVLSSRAQLSNLKKSQSKSRERILGGSLGFSKSHEQLMALRSLSQSVEALSALSRLNQQAEALCSSYNNLFQPGNEKNRMYLSLASIDQFDKDSKIMQENRYDSTVSLNTDIYNEMITQRNTDLNYRIGETPYDNPLYYNLGTLTCDMKSCTMGDRHCDKLNVYGTTQPHSSTKTYRGGSKLCDNTSSTKTGATNCDNKQRHRQTGQKCSREESSTKTQKNYMKSNKSTSQRTRKTDQEKLTVSNKLREKNEKRKEKAQQNLSIKSNEKNIKESISSPNQRRRSVSHVEQRLQERHERQERKQKEEGKKRRSSADYDRSPSSEKSKIILKKFQNNKKNLKRERKNSNKSSPFNSDVSQASSLESVEVVSVSSPDTPSLIVPIVTVTSDGDTNSTYSITSSQISDISLVIGNTDKINTNMTNSVSENKEETKKSLEETEKLSVSEKIKNFEKVSTVNTLPKPFCASLHSQMSFNLGNKLGSITEEDSMSDKSDSRLELRRTISNCSEVSTLTSSSSSDSIEKFSQTFSHILHQQRLENTTQQIIKNGDEEKKLQRSDSFKKTLQLNINQQDEINLPPNCSTIITNIDLNGYIPPMSKERSRSFSVHSTSFDLPKFNGRSRSNSFNFNNPTVTAMPWNTLCSGSIARAFGKFNLTDADISPSLSPRNVSPILSPLDQLAVTH